jgi:hypothetical protein
MGGSFGCEVGRRIHEGRVTELSDHGHRAHAGQREINRERAGTQGMRGPDDDQHGVPGLARELAGHVPGQDADGDVHVDLSVDLSVDLRSEHPAADLARHRLSCALELEPGLPIETEIHAGCVRHDVDGVQASTTTYCLSRRPSHRGCTGRRSVDADQDGLVSG